ncbi:DUF6968 family protein [Bosea sp. (in: a-proteobacteria)]|uniref:DUF6968 family protein n=1 Tax=Bosea sp. (in: a-proteobacteria) TaxID=1871050 RepID=UPI004034B1DF
MDLPEPIASRTFELGRSGIVTASFFAPFPDRTDWCCAYRIDWPSRAQDGKAFGVDSVQALFLAMKMVCAELANAPETISEGLTWLGMSDLGMPGVEPPSTS